MTTRRRKLVLSFAALVFTLGSLTFQQPNRAHALFGIDFCGTFFICLNPVSDVSNAVTAGATTTTAGSTTVTAGVTTAKLVVDGTPAETAVTDTILSPTVCDAFSNANLLLDSLDSVGNSLAGADKAKMSNTFFISYKVESTRSQLRDCWMPLQLIAQTAKGVTNAQNNNITANRQLAATKVGALTTLLGDYEKQKKESFQDVFSAIALSFAEAAWEEGAVRGMKALEDSTGIRNPSQYIDAVATQIYNIGEIQKNTSGNQENALIAASIYKSKIFGGLTGLKTANSLAGTAAKKYNVDQSKLDWSSPNFWTQVGGAADERAWPEYHLFQGQATVDKSVATGRELAKAETAAGNGFKNSRNCKDVLGQQKKIDEDLYNASTEVEAARLTVSIAELNNATPAVVEAAKQEYAATQDRFQAVQDRSNGGFGEAACGPIVDSSEKVSKVMGSWLDSLFKTKSQFNNANPGLFTSLASKLGKTLFNDIFKAQSGSKVIDDVSKNAVPLAVAATMQGILGSGGQQPGPSNQTGTPTATSGSNPFPAIGSGGTKLAVSYEFRNAAQMNLEIKYSGTNEIIPKNLKIVATEVGDPSKKTAQNLSLEAGDYNVTNNLLEGRATLSIAKPAKNTNYTVTLQGAQRSEPNAMYDIVTDSITVPGGTVAGAFTGIPSASGPAFLPRGPQVQFLPRGPEPYKY